MRDGSQLRLFVVYWWPVVEENGMNVIFHILGMVAGGTLIGWRVRRAGLKFDKVRFIVGFLFLIALGVAGARLAYVLADLHYYIAHWQEIFSLYGTIIQGAIIFGLLGLIPVARFVRVPFWKLGDLFVPGVALGQAIGRIGCLVQGCCYGVPIQLPGLEATGWLYPTQMMHGGANLLIALLLLYLDERGYKPFDGFLFLLYVILFSTQRFLIDFLRAVGPVFAPDMPFAGLRVPRVISVVSIALALIVLVWRWVSVRRN
jgi:phosphatidylglycerol:prolipoprotein diacylglycerol transferase